MSANPITCSNCGTENPAGQDFCRKCHQPLTASAEEALRESQDAQDREDLLGSGPQVNLDPARGVIDLPLPADVERHEGLPPRRH